LTTVEAIDLVALNRSSSADTDDPITGDLRGEFG
jgi:hypothetical protein